jgi:hypothetical protein
MFFKILPTTLAFPIVGLILTVREKKYRNYNLIIIPALTTASFACYLFTFLGIGISGKYEQMIIIAFISNLNPLVLFTLICVQNSLYDRLIFQKINTKSEKL